MPRSIILDSGPYLSNLLCLYGSVHCERVSETGMLLRFSGSSPPVGSSVCDIEYSFPVWNIHLLSAYDSCLRKASHGKITVIAGVGMYIIMYSMVVAFK